MRSRCTVYGEALLHVISNVAPSPAVAIGGVEITIGGPAAVVATQLALLGHAPRFVGTTGADTAGLLVESLLTHAGVDCAELLHVGATSRVVAVVGSADPALAAGPGSSWAESPLCTNPPVPEKGPVYVTGFPSFVPTIQALAAIGRRCVVDLGFVPLLNDPSALIRQIRKLENSMEIAIFSGTRLTEPVRRAVARTCLEGGARAVVVTLGADGAVLHTENEEFIRPAFAVEARDTLCAGDAFVAGLLCGLLEEQSMLTAVDFGQAVAAAKVAEFGGLARRTDAEAILSRKSS
ncbi:carbohydrate kinase family protein [Nocardia nova]